MAIKTFTTGEVLTASDTNTYLNNGGLVYITNTSWSAVSSASQVTVANVFSSTYDDYKILIEAYANTTGPNLSMKLRTSSDDSAADYQRWGLKWTTAASNLSLTGQTQWFINDLSTSSAYRNGLDMTIFSPNIATNTSATMNAIELNAGALFALALNKPTTTQYTGFSLFVSTGTFTGRLAVYGYRKA